MTDKKKHDDRDRQKISDEDLEDVAGGATAIEYGLIASLKTVASLITNRCCLRC